ncbi:MAG TPA: hypothetical protein VGJ31_14560 [Dongiaceae bacterium]|jgi:uncharacterized lipoprotein YehR (DUF1307 family)
MVALLTPPIKQAPRFISGGIMKTMSKRSGLIAVALTMSVMLASCGSKSVAGNTYEGAGGAFSVEFQSGGKAVTTIAGNKVDCTYAEDSKTVTLTCEGQPVALTVNDDGSLSGPPDGMMGKLTKKQ